MKNSVKTIITGAVCAAIAITGIGAGSVLTSAKLAEKKSIGSKAAYSAALNDAGVVSEKASEIKIDFERENGKYVFEVEFDADDKEYDYLVDAKNGEIISRKVENKDESNFANLTETPSQTTASSEAEKK
ncbi:MAG: PepSY domain-containing protein, partial [Acutalibacteraceae bacterium]